MDEGKGAAKAMRKYEVPVMELEQTGSKRGNTSEGNKPASRDSGKRA